MSLLGEYREAVARRFVNRMSSGDFVAQQGTEVLGGLPCTMRDGVQKTLSHTNALIAMQVLKDRGSTDPRFFVADQISANGWSLKPHAAGILMQFEARDADSGRHEVKRFHAYHASDIDGVPEWVRLQKFSVEDLEAALLSELGGSNLASGLHEFVRRNGTVGLDLDIREQLLRSWISAETGHPLKVEADWNGIAEWLKQEPTRLFGAIGDAELMFAELSDKAQAISFERGQGTAHSRRKDDMSTSQNLARVEQLYDSRQATLAVPYSQKDKARGLGAVWHPEHKFWFVPAGVELSLFRDWNLGEGTLAPTATESMYLDDFANALRELGLRVPKEIKADGQWHNCPVDVKKTNNAGAYKVVFGDAPYGSISNKLSGARQPWFYQGELLTPEQRKRLEEQARVREKNAAHEERERWAATASIAQEIFAKGLPADGHGYPLKKGVDATGLVQVSGKLLLEYEAFKGESGRTAIRTNQMYALVPLMDESGEIRNLQAISPDGKTKSFMRGAQKAGLMFVMGAKSFDALVASSPKSVVFSEGFATGATVLDGIAEPTVVCFDAGNMEKVVLKVGPKLPKETTKLLACDNDQYQVERALAYLAENTGVNPESGQGASVNVLSNYGISAEHNGPTRAINLGDIVADGEWHQGPKGKYRVTLTLEEGHAAIRSLKAEVVVDGQPRGGSQVFLNRGAEVGHLISESVDNCIVLMPSFSDLSNRPSDWNDLGKVAGRQVVVEHIGSQVKKGVFGNWFEAMRERNPSAVGMDDSTPIVPDLGLQR